MNGDDDVLADLPRHPRTTYSSHGGDAMVLSSRNTEASPLTECHPEKHVRNDDQSRAIESRRHQTRGSG